MSKSSELFEDFFTEEEVNRRMRGGGLCIICSFPEEIKQQINMAIEKYEKKEGIKGRPVTMASIARFAKKVDPSNAGDKITHSAWEQRVHSHKSHYNAS